MARGGRIARGWDAQDEMGCGGGGRQQPIGQTGQSRAPGFQFALPCLMFGWLQAQHHGLWVSVPLPKGPGHACVWGLVKTEWNDLDEALSTVFGSWEGFKNHQLLRNYRPLSQPPPHPPCALVLMHSLHLMGKETELRASHASPRDLKAGDGRSRDLSTGHCGCRMPRPGPPQARDVNATPPRTAGLWPPQCSVSFVPVPCGFFPES